MNATICPHCGQRGDQPPGLKLEEYEHLEAVMDAHSSIVLTGDTLPQRLTCRACGRSWPVPRGSIEVVKPGREVPG